MVEVQSHGFSFEKWVRDSFFGGYRGNYMQKWDVPPEENVSEAVSAEWRNVPVSIKTAKYGSPIGLGDILRQRQISVPFLMIAGFWRQRTSAEKWIEEIGVAYFSIATWAALWGRLSLDELRAIDSTIKDLRLPHTIARAEARRWKQATAALASVTFVVNPKIDSKTQRRIQCSLPFRSFWKIAAREPASHDLPELFGIRFPNPILSSARTFNT